MIIGHKALNDTEDEAFVSWVCEGDLIRVEEHSQLVRFLLGQQERTPYKFKHNPI